MPAGADAGGCWIDNVLIEAGLLERDDGLVRSDTALGAVRIADGRFAEVVWGGRAPEDGAELIDARGRLLLPGLRDMHVHLDKTFEGGPWRAPAPWAGVPARIAEEAAMMPDLAARLETGALALLDVMVSHGTTGVRSHCNVDHVVGATNVARIAEILRRQADRVTWEIVAFPQHGMRNPDLRATMAEALAAGATIVGGLDPAGFDRDLDGVLDELFALATGHDAGVDIHLHDPGELGIYEIERIVDRTAEAGWGGRVTISHAWALADVSADRARAVAERMAEAGVGVATTVTLDRAIPIPLLDRVGVDVVVGSDNTFDHWSPFGRGDMLEKVSVLAERFSLADERGLADALRFAAGRPGAYDETGRRTWPAVGAEASFCLVDATCTAEAVARRAKKWKTFHRGRESHSA